MKKFLIVDGNSIFYRAFFALPPLAAPTGEPTNAIFGFANILFKILREFCPDIATVALDSSKKTFRNVLFLDYKSNRPQMPTQLLAQLPLLKEFINDIGMKICVVENYEADDVIGTLASQAASENFFVYILTSDRDALQLINSNICVLLIKNSRTIIYDEKSFVREYGFTPQLLPDFKALAGDPADNIPGIRGIGSKSATSLILAFGDLDSIFANTYLIRSPTLCKTLENSVEDALLYKKLAQIVCDIPNLYFKAEEFQISPNFFRVKNFCEHLALNNVYKSFQKLFGCNNTNPLIDSYETNVETSIPAVDFKLILNVTKITIALDLSKNRFYVKIFNGDIFSVSHDELQKIFDNFFGTIILRDLKKWHSSFQIHNIKKIFDIELMAYLLYPEYKNYFPVQLLQNELKVSCIFPDSLSSEFFALEKLSEIYEQALKNKNLFNLYLNVELPLAKVLSNMETRGVFIDLENLKLTSTKLSEEITRISNLIYELTGEVFNLNSPKQLSNILFTKLKLRPIKKSKTHFSTNAEILESIKYQHPVVGHILNFRALTKLKSVYVDGISKLIDSTGRVHTSFNQTVTATGRLSSSNPNLQNIPVRTKEGRKIRALFSPSKKFDLILCADYSQIELRILAHMSQDKNLIDAFNNNLDIHTQTAAEIFNLGSDQITPELRRKAKAVNFGIIYGISEFGLAKDLHITSKEAGNFISLYFSHYPDVKKFLDQSISQARLLGYTTTVLGRRRLLPNINNPDFNVRALSERLAMNSPIQGSAADIIKLAMIRAEHALKDFESRIIIQVHDELVLEVKKSELIEIEKIVREVMENVIPLSVPLSVDIHSGENWALAK